MTQYRTKKPYTKMSLTFRTRLAQALYEAWESDHAVVNTSRPMLARKLAELTGEALTESNARTVSDLLAATSQEYCLYTLQCGLIPHRLHALGWRLTSTGLVSPEGEVHALDMTTVSKLPVHGARRRLGPVYDRHGQEVTWSRPTPVAELTPDEAKAIVDAWRKSNPEVVSCLDSVAVHHEQRTELAGLLLDASSKHGIRWANEVRQYFGVENVQMAPLPNVQRAVTHLQAVLGGETPKPSLPQLEPQASAPHAGDLDALLELMAEHQALLRRVEEKLDRLMSSGSEK